MTKTENKHMGAFVRSRLLFENRNGTVYSQRARGLYTVFSYGLHFPMYIWEEDRQVWYGNKDKYSATTSRHQALCRPPQVDQWFDTETMCKLYERGGMAKAVAGELENA